MNKTICNKIFTMNKLISITMYRSIVWTAKLAHMLYNSRLMSAIKNEYAYEYTYHNLAGLERCIWTTILVGWSCNCHNEFIVPGNKMHEKYLLKKQDFLKVAYLLNDWSDWVDIWQTWIKRCAKHIAKMFCWNRFTFGKLLDL